MAKSDARFGYKAKMSRDAHDLNQRFGFSCAPGMLLPIFSDIASPGDSYYIKHDLEFLRTAPLAAPAMVDVLVHYESFFVPMQMIYQPFENTYFSLTQSYTSFVDTGLLQNTSFPLFDYYYYISQIIGIATRSSRRSLAFRLADMLDLQAVNFCNSDATLDASGNYLSLEQYLDYKYHPNFFPWQILAYNTIFYYYYRLDDKSSFYSDRCNWDQYYSQTSAKRLPVTSDFMTIYQRPWNFDYFTSSYRSPIVSDANLQQLLPGGSYSVLNSFNTNGLSVSGSGTNVNSNKAAFGTGIGSSFSTAQLGSAVSTAMIRQAFANEKLAMITGRTRKNYDSQVLAHFGVKVPHDVKHDITMIGHDTYKLHVGEVTSLASTSQSALGELAGKGYASGKGHDIKFTAPCHGVIMTIFSIEPMKRYALGFNRINAVSSAFDLPIPEFDRLGNQPLYQYETGSATRVMSPAQSMTDVAAWKERYYQWKRRKDRVSVAFAGPMPGVGNTLNANNDWEPYFIAGYGFGRRNASVPSYAGEMQRYYIDVECMDALMLIPMRLSWGDGGTQQSPDEDWSTNPHLVYSHDPFIVDSFLKCKKVSWMSKDGEPVYPY